MRFSILLVLAFLNFSALCEDTVPITHLELKDGRKIDALRFSLLESDNIKTLKVTTLSGEKMSIPDSDVISRSTEDVAISKLPESARQELQKSRTAAAVRDSAEKDNAASNVANAKIASANRKEIEAREDLRKATDRQNQAQFEVTQVQAQFQAVQEQISTADKKLKDRKQDLDEVQKRKRKDKDKNDDRVREAEIRALKAQIKDAEDDKSKADAQKKKLDDLLDKKKSALNEANKEVAAIKSQVDKAAGEKSKAIVQSSDENKPKGSNPQPPKPENVTLKTITMKDGTVIRAKSIIEDDSGGLSVIDENGKSLQLRADQVQSRD